MKDGGRGLRPGLLTPDELTIMTTKDGRGAPGWQRPDPYEGSGFRSTLGRPESTPWCTRRSSALRERTVLPPEDASGLVRLARGLASVEAPAQARLVGPDGSQIDIPADLYGVLRDVVGALSEGLAITIAPHNTMLTTQEAADLLNISRPTLVRLMTAGEIPHSMRGRHRRVLLRDVLDYRERTRQERRQVLDQMAADAEDDGLYEATATPQRTR